MYRNQQERNMTTRPRTYLVIRQHKDPKYREFTTATVFTDENTRDHWLRQVEEDPDSEWGVIEYELDNVLFMGCWFQGFNERDDQ